LGSPGKLAQSGIKEGSVGATGIGGSGTGSAGFFLQPEKVNISTMQRRIVCRNIQFKGTKK
jgi:hypothetical protein